MKYCELREVAKFFSQFNEFNLKRVANRVFKLTLDKTIFLVDLNPNIATIYAKDGFIFEIEKNAPIDSFLKKLKVFIKGVELIENRKILKFTLSIKNSYKEDILFIFFEFYKRNPNLIITNSKGVVLEALSFGGRVIAGKEYVLPERREFKECKKEINYNF